MLNEGNFSFFGINTITRGPWVILLTWASVLSSKQPRLRKTMIIPALWFRFFSKVTTKNSLPYYYLPLKRDMAPHLNKLQLRMLCVKFVQN